MTDPYYAPVYDLLIAWAKTSLNEEITAVEEVAATRYSYVLKLQTKNDVFYLKKTPESFFIEAALLKNLRSFSSQNFVPEVIVADKEMLCFITRACGHQTFRTVFAGNFDIDLMAEALTRYKFIQRNSVAHTQELLDLGVPDWRLNKFPALYAELMRDAENLKIWGIESNDIARMEGAKASLDRLCENLAAYNIPDALNHSDFQDNNILIDTLSGEITIIDWAETNLGNPLLSLATCLRAITDRYQIPQGSQEYIDLENLFFKDCGLSPEDFQPALKQVTLLAKIYYAFTFQDIIARSAHQFPSWGNKIKSALLEFLDEIGNE